MSDEPARTPPAANPPAADETLLLCYENPPVFSFTAEIWDVKPMGGGRLGVLLSRSAFFPGGGGQPEDRGTLAGVPVEGFSDSVRGALHLVAEDAWRRVFPGADLGTGGLADGLVDEARRRDYSEQHTGQHLLSACLKNLLDVDTVSVHFGEETTAIETGAASIPAEDLLRVEREANRIIALRPAVETFTVDAERMGELELRRAPDLAGRVRIVRIPGTDTSACCGVHLHDLSPLGFVVIAGEERIRGRARIRFVTGERIPRILRKKLEILSGLRALLSCGDEDLAAAIEALSAEARLQKKRAAEFRSEVFRRTAAELAAGAPRFSPAGGPSCAFLSAGLPGAAAEELADFAARCLERAPALALVFNAPEPAAKGSGGGVTWIAAHNLKPEAGLNLKTLLPGLILAEGGKGGGGPARFQGSFPSAESCRRFTEALKEALGAGS